MSNIIDYVKWRGDLLFDNKEFNEVDNIIFSMLCYIDYSNVVANYPTRIKHNIKYVYSRIYEGKDIKKIKLGVLVPQEINELAVLIYKYPRYENIELSNYCDIESKEERTQFSAISFHIDRDLIYVSFCGTDDSLIGWQENIDMMTTCPVPAQQKASQYLDKISFLYPHAKLIVGGHSKGGNLAQYASIYCKEKTKRKIIKVYSNDGPGFVLNRIDKNNLEEIKEKLVLLTPQYSVIGRMFENVSSSTKVISSTFKGVMQHNAFSWQVDIDKFIEHEVDSNSVKLSEEINLFINKMSEEEREQLANNFYDFINAVKINYLQEIKNDLLDLHNNIKIINFSNKLKLIEFAKKFFKYKGL